MSTGQILRTAAEWTATGPDSSTDEDAKKHILQIAAEASWTVGEMQLLPTWIDRLPKGNESGFNTGIAQVLVSLQQGDLPCAFSLISSLRSNTARSLTSATAASLYSCHDSLLRLHVLHEVEHFAKLGRLQPEDFAPPSFLRSMDQRLAVLGSYMRDKQFLLGVRRAILTTL